MANENKDAARSTASLMARLIEGESLEGYLRENAGEMREPVFHEFISEQCRKRGEAPERVIRRANIESSFGHQLFRGARRPSRDTVLQLAFGLEADAALAQELLRSARMSPLYPRIKRDAAIIYCLSRGFSLVEAQTVLSELDLPLIGGTQK